MTNTTKYLLVGGAALVATVIILRRKQAAQDAAAQPSGVAGLVNGIKTVVQNKGGFSFSTPFTAPTHKLAGGAGSGGGGLPYGPGAQDGMAAISDALGLRQLHATLPAQAAYLTHAQEGLAGLH